MRYLMLVRVPRDGDVPPELDLDPGPWVEKHDATGERVMGDRLRPAEEALLVSVRDGAASIVKGRADTADFVVGGFDILDCADDDAAAAVAAAHPVAAYGVIELIPFWPFDEE